MILSMTRGSFDFNLGPSHILYPNIQLGGVAMPHSRCEEACNLGMII